MYIHSKFLKGCFMKNKFTVFGMLALVLTLGLVLAGCGSEGGDGTGTFRIRIIDIPAVVMTSRSVIGMGPAGALTESNAYAGRDTSLSSYDDNIGGTGDNQWYEFFMYVGDQRYIGSAGNYDIGFSFTQGSLTGTTKILRNVRLEVNTLNTFSYSSFQNF
jgi:hypothetical protein